MLEVHSGNEIIQVLYIQEEVKNKITVLVKIHGNLVVGIVQIDVMHKEPVELNVYVLDVVVLKNGKEVQKGWQLILKVNKVRMKDQHVVSYIVVVVDFNFTVINVHVVVLR